MNTAELHERIEHFLSLEEGWDSYGSKTIPPALVATAHALVDEFPAAFTFAAPLSYGSIQLEYYASDRGGPPRTGQFFEIMLHEDDDLFTIISGRHGNDGLEFDNDGEDVSLDEVRAFLREYRS